MAIVCIGDIYDNSHRFLKPYHVLDDGVIVEACIACANAYDITDDLRNLGLPVKRMGKPLTDFLLGDWKVLTF